MARQSAIHAANHHLDEIDTPALGRHCAIYNRPFIDSGMQAQLTQNPVTRLWQTLSTGGVLVATLFFAASLTPSLIPRSHVTQGVLSGLACAAGYGVGVSAFWLWRYLELPRGSNRLIRLARLAATIACLAIAFVFLWRATAWQNSVRNLMGMTPVESVYPFTVGLLTLVILIVLLALARLFRLIWRAVTTRLNPFIPRRIANVVGIAVAAIIFIGIGNGLLLRYALHIADGSFRTLDELMEPDVSQPADPAKTGSAASLIGWGDLGRAGRDFISTGPSRKDIEALLGREAREPIRVYVGLGSADTPEARAKLALAELKRVGGFERSTLIVATPTGTGWMDPAAMDTLDYLERGDVATVAIQYSYLASWLSLLVEPEYGGEAARALFSEVYGYWTTLPKDHRPKLYLYGLSLGAMNSQRSNELFEVLADPYQGALWAGPPFSSQPWGSITKQRNAGSPIWLPRFRDGSYVRFTNQSNALAIAGESWGTMRIVYLQYASDPIVFFDPLSIYRPPVWMHQPRGPDVSPALRWYPIVSFLQSLVDMAIATTTPAGYGHVYAPQHYIDAWIAVLGAKDWSPGDIARLKQHFTKL